MCPSEGGFVIQMSLDEMLGLDNRIDVEVCPEEGIVLHSIDGRSLRLVKVSRKMKLSESNGVVIAISDDGQVLRLEMADSSDDQVVITIFDPNSVDNI